jgi:hypothetical protein
MSHPAAAVASLLLILGACRSEPGASGESTSGEITSGEACEGLCIPNNLEDWSGPIRFQANGACDGFTTFADVAVEPGSCVCTCGGVDACAAAVREYQTGACSTEIEALPFAVNVCTGAPNGELVTFEVTPVPNPTCLEELIEDLPSPEWASERVACPADMEDCGDGQRCAAANGDELCIHADGDRECPAGMFSEREVRFRSFADERTCTSCGCSPAAAVQCAGTGVASYSETEAECLSSPGSPTPLECGPVGGPFVRVDVGGSAACAPSQDSVVAGVVVELEPVTFCCAS